MPETVIPAIEFGNETNFNYKYMRFETDEKRDEHYEWLKNAVPPENMKSVSRVNLIIRVESVKQGEN